jgi:hypothetical protein
VKSGWVKVQNPQCDPPRIMISLSEVNEGERLTVLDVPIRGWLWVPQTTCEFRVTQFRSCRRARRLVVGRGRGTPAPPRRRFPRLHGRGGSLLADGLRPRPAVDALCGAAVLDGAVVQPQR